MVQKKDVSGSGNILVNRIVVEMDDVIHLLDPNATPFLRLSAEVGKESVDSQEFNWMEDDYISYYDEISGAMLANETELVVADPTKFAIGDVICCPDVTDYDHMLVIDVNVVTSTITVIRQIGSEASAPALADASVIAKIGTAFEEGSDKAEILSVNPENLFNFNQIFKKTFGATESIKATKLYGDDELAYNRKKAGIEFAIEMEKAMLFGRRGKIAVGPMAKKHPIRFMRGLIPFITTNVTDLGGAALTEPDWDDFLDTAFQNGNDTKYVLSSNAIMSYINSFAKNKLQTVSKDKTYGINVTQYIASGKTVYLINSKKIFDRAPWNKMAVVIDIDKIKTINFRATKLITNVQGNGEDTEEDMYISEVSLKVVNEKCHAVLKGVA